MRVKNDITLIVLALRSRLLFDLREVVAPKLTLDVDTSHHHENIGEIVLFDGGLKPRVVQLLLMIDIP